MDLDQRIWMYLASLQKETKGTENSETRTKLNEIISELEGILVSYNSYPDKES